MGETCWEYANGTRTRKPTILKPGMKHQGGDGGALQSVYKSWPWDDLDLSHGKVNIGRPCI